MPENEKTRLQKFMGGGKQGYQIAFQMACSWRAHTVAHNSIQSNWVTTVSAQIVVMVSVCKHANAWP